MSHLIDVNVWLALLLRGHVSHQRTREWFASVPAHSTFVICRATQLSVLRLLTTPGMMAPYNVGTMTNSAAWDLHDRLVTRRGVRFWPEEPPGLEPIWRAFAARVTASPKLWMDAYLAAFAIAGSLRFVTLDKAFRQFEGLDLVLLGDEPAT